MSRPSRKRAPRQARKQLGGDEVRLQKALAAAGLGSRRNCEELIVAGRVQIDGEVADELGVKVDPHKQEIRVDGEVVKPPRRIVYAVHKPKGVVSTHRDPEGRPRVVDLAPGGERMFTVGRLDKSSEGLILVTNDGELANRLAHPRYGVEKTYQVEVVGQPSPDVFKQLRQGVHLAEAFVKPVKARLKRKLKHSSLLEIVLQEGRNREIRRMLARVGHKVLNLTRIAIGPLRLGELPSGAHRELTRNELKALENASQTTSGESKRRKRPTKPKTSRAAPAKRRTSKKPKSEQQDVTSGKRMGAVIGEDAPEPQPPQRPKKRKSKPKDASGKIKKRGGQNKSATSRTKKPRRPR